MRKYFISSEKVRICFEVRKSRKKFLSSPSSFFPWKTFPRVCFHRIIFGMLLFFLSRKYLKKLFLAGKIKNNCDIELALWKKKSSRKSKNEKNLEKMPVTSGKSDSSLEELLPTGSLVCRSQSLTELLKAFCDVHKTWFA